MITKLQVERFRGINTMTIDGLKTVNVFVGKNNCGKTSLLEAVLFWASVRRPDIALFLNQNRELLADAREQLMALFYQYDMAEPFIVSATSRDDVLKVSAKQYFKPNKNIDISLIKKSIKAGMSVDTDRQVDGIEVCYNKNQANAVSVYLLEVEQDDKINRIMTTHPADFPPLTTPIVQYISAHDRSGEKEIAKIIGENREAELISIFNAFSTDIRHIKIGGEKKTVLIDEGRLRSLPLALQGDGVVKAASIFASVITRKDGVVLIDEIDNGMHASTLKPFWTALIEAAKKNNTQIFATTHSWESLECLKSALDENPALQGEVSVFNLVRRNEDKISVYAYAYSGLKNVIESEMDIR